MKTYTDLFDRMVSSESLFSAWDEFKSGKRNRRDVREFEWRLEENIFLLREALVSGTYRHGSYDAFFITDPKQRHIHKATVRDRILHHALFKALSPVFEETFIQNSFSCRVGYGTHRGVAVMAQAIRRVARNGTVPCFVLKCDVRKFFDSMDHEILLGILARRIKDPEVMRLLRDIVGSFGSGQGSLFRRQGVPIGNLTSQLFANVYMNELDQFVKGELRVRDYGRYTDDFLIVAGDRAYLEGLLPPIEGFLREKLRLELHPRKVEIRKVSQGIDFLGYTTFLKYSQVRTRTKQRMFAKVRRRVGDFRLGKISQEKLDATVRSYLGVLSHANAFKVRQELLNRLWY